MNSTITHSDPKPHRQQVWFTSDLHIGHKNILEYSKRPYKTVDEMDWALVNNWNERVHPADLVYCLGDFALCDAERATMNASRLNGNKFLIFGNHDKRLRKDKDFLKLWTWARDIESITVEDQKIILCHYAMLTWNQSHRGSWNLHGHSHGSLPDDSGALRIDVGVNCWNMRPVSFHEIKARMSLKTFVPVDHHE